MRRFIMQRCFPPLRQQAGTPAPASVPSANKGAARGRPNRASSKMASSFRTGLIGTQNAMEFKAA